MTMLKMFCNLGNYDHVKEMFCNLGNYDHVENVL